jgi:CheY-like chemotaxis protein
MTEGKLKLVIVEDNKLDSYITERVIKGYDPAAQVLVFNKPDKALEYLEEKATHANTETLALLLDIYMPEVDGWRFLEAFEKLPESVKASCRLYMLTSSILLSDKLKAESTDRVLNYFHKPLKGRHLKVIYGEGNACSEGSLPG